MRVEIKVTFEYVDTTRVGDIEQRSKPKTAAIQFDLTKGDSFLCGSFSIPFDEYKEMKYEDLINKIHEKSS
ncbi:hypothetical protein [Bacillus bingmayongensis]|uniref:hypothetical protein n=1 Tax=Bacillus bingmayongensis TaxID=1150157 RepID=UPI001C8D82AD|nr:hypothetical protein [Bacillus bingmayongensis]MBY0597700.1 hypothetical protein [Bacillus bingmayongensis]